jgi:hypothetical protein
VTTIIKYSEVLFSKFSKLTINRRQTFTINEYKLSFPSSPHEWHELFPTLNQALETYSKINDEPRLPDKYTELTKIGIGGMGIVYKAVNNLKRVVAVKILRQHLILDKKRHQQFEREAQILASLKHKNIVQIYKAGILEEEQLYFEMEYLDGRNLREYMEDRLDQRSPISMQEALKITISI